MESRGKRLVALCKNVNVQMLSEEEPSNHNSAQNDSSSTDDEPLSVKRNRWTKSQPEKWKKNVMKEKRSMGQPYRSTKGILRPAKTPKPARCDGCKFKCTTKFSDEERKSICNDYWKLDYCRQKDFILSCIVNTPPKCHRIRTGTGVPKTSSRKYHLKRNSDCIQVCKAFFLGTLCISHGPVDNAIAGVNNNGLFNAVDKRGRNTPSNKTPDQDIQRIKNHIESFPTMESHYCRKNTKRQYLDPSLSITKLYDLYVQQCVQSGIAPVSQITYRRIFCKNYNLSFFKPKKDQCEVCNKFKNKSLSQEDYKQHLQRRDQANAAKANDKIRANEDTTFISVSFDLQSVLHIPSSQVSMMYYSLKLCAYNLTIYEAALPNKAFCYAWSEVNEQRGSSEIGSALYKWIETIPTNVKEISLFSDTCSGQNRNQYIAALFLYIVQYTHLEVVHHNFMEKGHSYMEVDSMHSAIETAKKHVSIFTMNELLNVFKMARSKRLRNKRSNPYFVQELKYGDFLNLKFLADAFLKNRLKDESGEKVCWLKIKIMRYEKSRPGCILFKYNYDEVAYHILHVYGRGRPPNIPNLIPRLYSGLQPITEKKKNCLLRLCSSDGIPEEYHAWYKSIPVDTQKRTTVPEPANDSDSESESDVM
ncbi:dna-directed rna polymerases i ii and iii subunit rpabc2 [Holotrichia oblita]|uniref:Dna-directed rna polymerases i ii and iii subunit rpabc2 n=2 Tax=Holotrichia oblita TaxID=644536 RepID=A0ACB9SNL1_HOLOL|nr:dna-directed rna polymerases i ii and iii subunit rpabc2 [Holotrichia oblita]